MRTAPSSRFPARDGARQTPRISDSLFFVTEEIQADAGGALPNKCESYEEQSRDSGATNSTRSNSPGAVIDGVTAATVGEWMRNRQTAHSPSSAFTTALAAYFCRVGRGWKCAAASDCVNSRIAANKAATPRFHRCPPRRDAVCITKSLAALLV